MNRIDWNKVHIINCKVTIRYDCIRNCKGGKFSDGNCNPIFTKCHECTMRPDVKVVYACRSWSVTKLIFWPVMATFSVISPFKGRRFSKGVSSSLPRSCRCKSKTLLKTEGRSRSQREIWHRWQSISDKKFVKMMSIVASSRLGSLHLTIKFELIRLSWKYITSDSQKKIPSALVYYY